MAFKKRVKSSRVAKDEGEAVKSPERLADSGQESDSPFKYVGDELELFATARNWRAYWQHRVRSHLRGSVLEVGAGIGTVTRDLVVDATRWLAIEPDPSSAAQVRSLLRTHEGLEVVIGTIRDLPLGENFDTALYVDVLEHIENDAEELKRVAERLRPGGRLIVLVPARPQLYSAFDRAVGHYRRYTAGSLDALRPPGFEVLQAESLDVFGLLVSALNKGALRQERPTRWQILFWDRILVPMSRLIDPILRRRVGKSLLVVWVKRIPAEPSIV